MEKKPDNVIITLDKSGEEIIDQEIKAICNIWPSDYLIVEHSPMKSVKITMEYSVLK